MKIFLNVSSILPMLDFLRDLKSKRADANKIREIFNHKDYDFEFRRYEISQTEPFINYFMRLSDIKESEIPELDSRYKNMLKNKHTRWLNALENPDYYESLYKKITGSITDEALAGICETVKRGLPADANIDDIHIISTMSIGTSFGYVFDNALHFDIMGFNDDNLKSLPSLLAHEIHHLAMSKYASSLYGNFSPEERYIFNFTGEGLAVKFCNNAKGAVSKPLYANLPVNECLDEFSMEYLNSRFYEALGVFKESLSDIRAGKMKNEDIYEQFNKYWWNPYTEEQSRDEEPLLKQSLIYSFGNDLFGVIYDAFGADILFDCVRHPLKTVEYFEQAVKKI